MSPRNPYWEGTALFAIKITIIYFRSNITADFLLNLYFFILVSWHRFPIQKIFNFREFLKIFQMMTLSRSSVQLHSIQMLSKNVLLKKKLTKIQKLKPVFQNTLLWAKLRINKGFWCKERNKIFLKIERNSFNIGNMSKRCKKSCLQDKQASLKSRKPY